MTALETMTADIIIIWKTEIALFFFSKNWIQGSSYKGVFVLCFLYLFVLTIKKVLRKRKIMDVKET